MNTSIIQGPLKMLSQESQIENNTCYTSCCWIAQVFSWIFLLIGIFASGIMFIFFALCYIFYLVLEFCSNTSRYLLHKSTNKGIHEKMGIYFKTPPEIQFFGECYHYEERHYTRTNSEGKIEHYTSTEKVVTYTENYSLPYYSERDVSGVFYLNCRKAYVSKKHYIKLELQEEINFADAISYYDYEREKNDFWSRNRFRDVHFYFHERRLIPGMDHHNLIKLVENEPFSINFIFFFISTILTLAEFYRLYFDSFCVYQKFKVRKIISTRYDLNQTVYNELTPQINLITNQYTYDQNYYNYLNDGYELQLPTKEELEAAKQFEDKVPDYKISSGGGVIKAGVIIDDPQYSTYNPNEAPPKFAQVSGNAALSQNQINSNGQPPEGYNQPGFKFDIVTPENNIQNQEVVYTTSRQLGH